MFQPASPNNAPSRARAREAQAGTRGADGRQRAGKLQGVCSTQWMDAQQAQRPVPDRVDSLHLEPSRTQFLEQSESMAKALHLATSGDSIIVLAGHPIGAAGGTKILIVEEIT